MNNNHGQDAPHFKNTVFDVVAIAASAGGLAALSAVLDGLKADFPAAIVVVQHLDRHHQSLMAEILGRRTALKVVNAPLNEKLQAGHVYVAPPDFHLLINPDTSISLTQSELVNFLRPSADLLFKSVAVAFKSRAIAVVLTGTGHDGAVGVAAIKKTGGTVIVQNQHTAEFGGMPESAIRTGVADFILPLEEIPKTLSRLVQPFPNTKINHD